MTFTKNVAPLHFLRAFQIMNHWNITHWTYRVSHIEMFLLNWLWQIEKYKLDFVWKYCIFLRFGNLSGFFSCDQCKNGFILKSFEKFSSYWSKIYLWGWVSLFLTRLKSVKDTVCTFDLSFTQPHRIYSWSYFEWSFTLKILPSNQSNVLVGC